MTEGCPGCGGPTEYDREVPPNPYFCSDECESNPMTDYYKHIYSQRDVDLIRGDLMARIAELTGERDELERLSRSMQHYLDLQDDWRERRTYSCWENEKRQTALTRARAAVVVRLKTYRGRVDTA